MNEKVLIVEDEQSIRDFLSFDLKKEGYTIVCASEGSEAIDIFHKEHPDLVLLDLMLPKLNGLEVLKAMRACSDVPVLCVTAKDEESDKVSGLELGADDYITKPFSSKELIARIRANLRKRKTANASVKIRLGDLDIDWDRAEIFRSGMRLILTAKEYDVLKLLYDNRNRVLPRDMILEKIWGYDFDGDTRVVDTTIKRLRKKVGGQLIETVRGLGYRISR